MTNEAPTPLKSMRLFFIDNQGAWPTSPDGTSKAELVDGLVVWPDDGKYPTFVPVAAAKHPQFDGSIIVMAGSRGLVVAFCEGAHDDAQIRATLSKGKPEQYRISLDAIVHRLMLWRDDGEGRGAQDDASPLALLSWLASSHRTHAQVLCAALHDLMHDPERLKEVDTLVGGTSFDIADAMLTTIQQTVMQRGAQADAGKVPRRG